MLRKTFWIFSAYKKYLKEVWRKNYGRILLQIHNVLLVNTQLALFHLAS